MLRLKSALAAALLPWHARFLPLPSKGARPYFGPYAKPYGGPDLKLRKLKAHFGNHFINPNLIYLVSGKPLSLPYLMSAKRRGCRVVLNQDGVYYPAWYKGDWKAANAALRRYHELADHIIFQSVFCRESAERLIGPSAASSEILHNAVDTSVFHPRGNPAPGDPVRLLIAAYFNPTNDSPLRTVFRAVRVLLDRGLRCRLLMAGKIHGHSGPSSGPLPSWMEAAAREWDVRAHLDYLGPYSPEQAPSIFRSGDIFLNLKYNDPCPSSVLEAMASGLPVIHSRSGGTPELVGEAGVGIPAPVSYEREHIPSPEEVASAVEGVVKDYATLASAARRRAETFFSLDRWLKRHAALFNGFIKR